MAARFIQISIMGLVLTLVAVACGGEETATSTVAPSTTATSTTTTPTTTQPATTTLDPTLEAPAGFLRHVDTEYGFVMDLPENWLTIGTDPADLEQMLDLGGEIAGVDPELLDLARDSIAGGVALIAYDTLALDTPFATNLNVLRTERVGGIGPTLYENVVPAQLELFGAEDISTSRTSLPAGEAVITEFSTPALDSRGLQYTIFTEDHLWIITLSASDVAVYADALASMVDSFGVA